MPNRFHYRARIENLWRHATSDVPGYRRLKSLDTINRELFAPNPRARLNYALFLATDPFDVARHKLRDLYDRPNSTTPAGVGTHWPPLPLGEGWGEGSPAPDTEDELSEEDDDPW